MKRFWVILGLMVSIAGSVGAKTLSARKQEGAADLRFNVQAAQIEKAGADTIRFPVAIVSSQTYEGRGFTFQSIIARVRFNCTNGAGEISSVDFFKGTAPESESAVARSTTPQAFSGGQHAYLGKDLAFAVCQEAAQRDMVAAPGAAIRPPATVGGPAPSTLELRVMQSRLYETSAPNFSKAMKEICANGGGNFIPIGRATLNCIGSKMALFSDFTMGVGTFAVELDEEDKKTLGVRLRITDGLSRPTYDRPIYEALFKELSEALGVMDISVQRKKAE